jgi:hypothetical protein
MRGIRSLCGGVPMKNHFIVIFCFFGVEGSTKTRSVLPVIDHFIDCHCIFFGVEAFTATRSFTSEPISPTVVSPAYC